MYFPPVTVECTKQMDSIITEECSDLHLEEQQDPAEDGKLTVRKTTVTDL